MSDVETELRSHITDLEKRLDDEFRRCESARRALDVIRRDIDQAIAAHDPSDPRHPSHGGQHTNGRCCPLGNLNPSAIRPLREWRQAIDDLNAQALYRGPHDDNDE